MMEDSLSALWKKLAIWHESFEILSMDAAKEFLSSAGLSIQRTEELQKISQDYVRAILDASPNDEMAFFDDALLRIENELGKDLAEAIHEWIRINNGNYQNELFASINWFRLFGRLTQVFDFPAYNVPLVPLRLPEAKVQSIKIAFLMCLAKDYRLQQAVDIIKKSDLSTWDTYLCSKYPNGTSPLDGLLNQVSFTYHMAMWQEIEDALTASEIEILVQWGQEQNNEIIKIIDEALDTPQIVHPPFDVRKLLRHG